METLYQKCPADLVEQKRVFRALSESYASYSPLNDWRRMMLFFRYGSRILAYQRKSAPRRWLFALKMFFVLR